MKQLWQNIVCVFPLILLYFGVQIAFAQKSDFIDVPTPHHLNLYIELPEQPLAKPKQEDPYTESSQSNNSEKELEQTSHYSFPFNFHTNYQKIVFRSRAFQNLQFISLRKSIYLLYCTFRL
ncbi:MAG: hypothetical protein MUE85_23800 [Microscillaceae bacterium]|jgi:hypothetical protein|nr:hypothetical protein [Microscillaceae bacterium]